MLPCQRHPTGIPLVGLGSCRGPDPGYRFILDIHPGESRCRRTGGDGSGGAGPAGRGLITRRSEVQSSPPPLDAGWRVSCIGHGRLTSVFAFRRDSEDGAYRGFLSGPTQRCHMQPCAGWRSSCGTYAALLRSSLRSNWAMHRAAQGMPYAVALINRARPERCDLDFGRSDRRQVGRQCGDLYSCTGSLLRRGRGRTRMSLRSLLVWVTQALDRDLAVQIRQRGWPAPARQRIPSIQVLAWVMEPGVSRISTPSGS